MTIIANTLTSPCQAIFCRNCEINDRIALRFLSACQLLSRKYPKFSCSLHRGPQGPCVRQVLADRRIRGGHRWVADKDEQRAVSDWADIRLLIELSAQNGKRLDWALMTDYLDIFGLRSELGRMRGWYGKTDRG
jgi:hypothetical protein